MSGVTLITIAGVGPPFRAGRQREEWPMQGKDVAAVRRGMPDPEAPGVVAALLAPRGGAGGPP